jgi:hypothetical protein
MKAEFNNWLSNPLEDHEIEWMLDFVERQGMQPPLKRNAKHYENPYTWESENDTQRG